MGSLMKKSYNDFGEDEEFLGTGILDMNKEYGILSYYDSYGVKSKMSNLYNFVSSSLGNGQWTFINLEEVQNTMIEHFKYLNLKKRYTGLLIESCNILSYDEEGFHINEHTFDSLDEVKRALDNKMFL